jgi:Flp pilus assembly protein CpaB
LNRINLFLRRKFFIVVFAVIFLLTAALVFLYIKNHHDNGNIQKGTFEVYIADSNIPGGTVINERQIEKSFVSGELFSDKYITEKKEIVGKKAIRDITESKVISSDDLEQSSGQSPNYLKFSSYIPSGYRAVSLPVVYFGRKILLNSGDSIDLISTWYNSKNEEFISETILLCKKIILINGQNTRESSAQKEGNYDAVQSSEPGLLNGILSDASAGEDIVDKQYLILTFYLTSSEAEKALNALQLGPLYMAICPGKGDAV